MLKNSTAHELLFLLRALFTTGGEWASCFWTLFTAANPVSHVEYSDVDHHYAGCGKQIGQSRVSANSSGMTHPLLRCRKFVALGAKSPP